MAAMLITLSTLALLLAPPLPDLRTEATAGGSIFHFTLAHRPHLPHHPAPGPDLAKGSQR